MNSIVRIPLFICLMINVLIIAGCASTSGDSGGSSPVDGTPPVGSEPGDPGGPGAGGGDVGTPIPDGSDGGEGTGGTRSPSISGGSRAETVNKDLEETVDKVKGRNGLLPQRGVFFSVGIRNLERTPEEGDTRTGSESDITNLSIGYDQILSDAWVVGALADISRRDESSAQPGQFSISSDSLSLFLFSSLIVNESIDVSGYAGFGRSGTSSSRFTQRGTITFQDSDGAGAEVIDIMAGGVEGDADSDVFSGGLSISHRTLFGEGNQFIVKADADLARIITYDFTEQGSTNSELRYREHIKDNFKFTLSGGLSRTFSLSTGVFVPGVTVAVISENPTDDPLIADLLSSSGAPISLGSTPYDDNYGKVEFDIVWVRPSGLQLFGNLNTRFAHSLEESVGANVGARLEF